MVDRAVFLGEEDRERFVLGCEFVSRVATDGSEREVDGWGCSESIEDGDVVFWVLCCERDLDVVGFDCVSGDGDLVRDCDGVCGVLFVFGGVCERCTMRLLWFLADSSNVTFLRSLLTTSAGQTCGRVNCCVSLRALCPDRAFLLGNRTVMFLM